MRPEGPMRRSRVLVSDHGFTLVEVMVALVVVSLGLLGIAKMQALALASTGTAKMRSLASITAASLASTMLADRNYWSAINLTPFTVTVASNGTVTATDSNLNTAPAAHCAAVTTTCTSAQVAAQDLKDWATTLGSVLPGGNATITCTVDPAVANPVACMIQLNWNEHVVALSTASNASQTAAQNQAALAGVSATQYTLYVEP